MYKFNPQNSLQTYSVWV